MASSKQVSDSSLPSNQVLIENECLSYAFFHFSKFPTDSIKRILLSFFLPSEISEAKSLLWKCFPLILGDISKRRSTVSRSASEADVIDIMEAVKAVDGAQVCSHRFLCGNLDRIPKFAPDEASLFSLADRVSSLERDFIKLQERVAVSPPLFASVTAVPSCSATAVSSSTAGPHCYGQPTSQWADNLQLVALPPLKGSMSQQTVTTSGMQMLNNKQPLQKKQPPLSGPIDCTDVLQLVDLPSVSSDGSKSNKLHQARHLLQQGDGSRKQFNQQSQGNSHAQGNSGHTGKSNRDANFHGQRDNRKNKLVTDNDGFQLVQRKKHVFGTNKGYKQLSQPRTAALFVHRINKNIGPEDVKEVCEAGGVHVYEIEEVSKENASMRSFRVVIDFIKLDTALTDEFWPEGVGCKRYFSTGRKPTQAPADDTSGAAR